MPGSGRSPNASPLLAAAVLRGLGNAMVVSLVAYAVVGSVYYLVPFGDGVMSSLLVASSLIACLAGGLAAASASRTHGWLNGGLAGALYVLSLWMVQSLGLVAAEGLTLVATLIALALGTLAGGIGGMLGMAVGQ